MKTLFLTVTLGLWAALAGTARASAISDLYADKCAGCHADNGTGNCKYGKKFGAPDFTSAKWQAQAKDAEIRKTIEDGVVENGKVRMPPWKAKLTPQQIADLGKFAKSFGAK